MATNTLTTNSTAAEAVQRVRYSRLWWVGPLAIVLAIAANLVVRAIGMALSPLPLEFMPLSTAMPTVFFTVIGVIAAIIVFVIVGRFARQPARTYTNIAIVALVLSLIPDVLMLIDPAMAPSPGVTLAGVIILMVQHVVTAAVVVWLLTTQAVDSVSARK